MIWGRIGKILELWGGLYFVIEWIGRENLAKATATAAAIADEAEKIELPTGVKWVLWTIRLIPGVPSLKTLRSTLHAGAWVVATENRARGLNLLVILLGFMFDFLNS